MFFDSPRCVVRPSKMVGSGQVYLNPRTSDSYPTKNLQGFDRVGPSWPETQTDQICGSNYTLNSSSKKEK